MLAETVILGCFWVGFLAGTPQNVLFQTKIQTGVGVENMEFPGVLNKEHVEIQGVN